MRRSPRPRGVFSRIRPTAAAVIRNHTWLPSGASSAPNQRVRPLGCDSSIESSVRVGEPLRAGVVEVRQRALPERLRGVLVVGNRTPWISGCQLIHPLDPFGRVEPAGAQLDVLQRGDRLGVSELPPARVGRWVFAEVERDLISESTREGLARAKSSGSSP